MRSLLNWENILFINTALFPDIFISAIEVLFFSVYLNLSFSDFSFIYSFCLFISIFLQVPTGYLSDKLGRKLMLILGKFGDIVGILAIIFLPHLMSGNLFFVVLIIEALRTMMRTLANGNFSVLIFEMFEKTGIEEEEFMKKSSDFFSIGVVIAASSGLISTILFSYVVIFPLVIDMIVKVIQLISNFFIIEFPYEKENKQKEKDEYKFDKSLLYLLLVLSLMFSVSRGTFSLYQPIMTSLGIPLVYYGLMIMIINFSILFLLKLVKKYLKKYTIYNLLPIVVIVLFSQIFIVLSVYTDSLLLRFVIISISFSLMQIIRLFSEGLSSYFINIKIKDKKDKTTIFSSYSMITHIMLSLFFFAMGVIQESLSYLGVYLMVSIISGIMFLLIKIKSKGVT